MVRQMDMSYSYKPVLLKAVLQFADDKGRVKLSDIVTYFREFYESRRAAGWWWKRPTAFTPRAAIQMPRPSGISCPTPSNGSRICRCSTTPRTLGVIQVDESVWKKLTQEEKTEIERICDEKLEQYYRRLQ